jgi:transaldolase
MNDLVGGLRVKIFADGASVDDIVALAADPLVQGFTTNPTLMRKAGVDDYLRFAKELVETVTDRPISFEVTSDDLDEMGRQALALRALGDNVMVKIPITDTAGRSTASLLERLSGAGVALNATALMTTAQVRQAAEAMAEAPPSVISVFAGRIADAGVDPVPVMTESVQVLEPYPNLELLWASPREVLNVVQADRCGCHVITMTPDLLAKLEHLGRDLDEFSLATVRMFRDDAVAAGYEF